MTSAMVQMNGMNGYAAAAGAGGGLAGGGAASSAEERWAEQFLPPPLQLKDRARAQKAESCLSPLVLDGRTLRRVAAVFERELEAGLRSEPSSLQMENTYVPEMPDGTEEGLFLALDLGGTNFRVLLLELAHGELLREDVKQYHISDELRLGPGEDLFNFLADCVLDFVQAEGMFHEELSLGFTFSFPMKQHSISSGELITWTKSFNCGGMEGVDVAALLQACLDRRGLKVAVRVLLNDTTGTLVAGARIDHRAAIGAILGTGSNGCYLERASRVSHWEAERRGARDVVVDVEWGAFGDNGCLDFIRTDLDREVDDLSLLRTSFTFEKYIGGKYLGEVCAASLRALHRAGLLPAAPAPAQFHTSHLSLIDSDASEGSVSGTLGVLAATCPAARFTAEDARLVQHAARVVVNRAAQLVAVCISTLIRRIDRAHCAVAMDGSVFAKHPAMPALLARHTALLAPAHQFSFFRAEDGSGKGSALTAAVAARIAART